MVSSCKSYPILTRSYISLPSLFSTNNTTAEQKSTGLYFVEKTIVGFKREHLYDIVINVDEYKQFVPYCIESKVLKSYMQVNSSNGEVEKGCMEALMKVGFSNPATALLASSLLDSHISQIEYKQPEYILVKAETKGQNRVFDYLCSEWKFEPLPQDPNCCIVHFTVDFRFSNTLYQYVAEVFFKFCLFRFCIFFFGNQ